MYLLRLIFFYAVFNNKVFILHFFLKEFIIQVYNQKVYNIPPIKNLAKM